MILKHFIDWTRESTYQDLVQFFNKTAIFLTENWSRDAEIVLANRK